MRLSPARLVVVTLLATGVQGTLTLTLELLMPCCEKFVVCLCLQAWISQQPRLSTGTSTSITSTTTSSTRLGPLPTQQPPNPSSQSFACPRFPNRASLLWHLLCQSFNAWESPIKSCSTLPCPASQMCPASQPFPASPWPSLMLRLSRLCQPLSTLFAKQQLTKCLWMNSRKLTARSCSCSRSSRQATASVHAHRLCAELSSLPWPTPEQFRPCSVPGKRAWTRPRLNSRPDLGILHTPG